MTLYELCAECRNWFKPDIFPGTYTITGGVMEPLPEIPDGAWIRIVGSVFNDGCWQYPSADMTDETFDGAVWLMHVPPDFVALYNDINVWEDESKKAIADATAEVLSGPYSSESFAGYTYTRKTSIGDIPTTWKDPRLGFSARLDRWRKVYV
jgi:hypothetical protein